MLSHKRIKKLIVADLKEIGIKKNDVILIRGSLANYSQKNKEFENPLKQIWLYNIFFDCLEEVVGKYGTLVTLTFTKSFSLPIKKNNYVFDPQKTPSNSGYLPYVFLKRKNAIRSSHPVCSFAAIGKHANKILKNHNEHSSSYKPMKKLIELNGKMLIFGILNSSPGFTTTHLVQEDLGLTKMFRRKYGVFFKANNKIQLFERPDIGGCSRGFSKFYDVYRKNNLLNENKIIGIDAMCINARRAYNLEYEIINKNNIFPLCGDKLCFKCRVNWKYNNNSDIAEFIFYFILKKLVLCFKFFFSFIKN